MTGLIRASAAAVAVVVLFVAAFATGACQTDRGAAGDSQPERFPPFSMTFFEQHQRADGVTERITYQLVYHSQTAWTMTVVAHENPDPPGSSRVGRVLSFDGVRPLESDPRQIPSETALPTVEPGDVLVPNQWFVDRDYARSPYWQEVALSASEREQLAAGLPVEAGDLVQYRSNDAVLTLDGRTQLPLRATALNSGRVVMQVTDLTIDE